MRILDRYFILEIVVPFGFGLALFSGIFLGVDVLYDLVKLISRFDLPWWEAARYLSYQIIWILGYVLPMGTLLAVVLAFGRLNHHGEITAFRAAGISFLRLLAPVAGWGLAISLLGVWLNGHVVPDARGLAERLEAEARSNGVRPRSTDNLLVRLRQEQEDWIVFARGFQAEQDAMEGVCILRLRDRQPVGLLTARLALWQGESWQFQDWQYRDYSNPNYEVSLRQQGAAVEPFRFTILPGELALSERSPESLRLDELRQYIGTRRGQDAPPRELAPFVYEYHSKWAIPFASLGFALLAAPLALQPPRTTTSIGLGLSIIVILLYELIWNILRFLGREGSFPPLWAAWLPNLFVLLVAGLLVRRAQR